MPVSAVKTQCLPLAVVRSWLSFVVQATRDQLLFSLWKLAIYWIL